MSPKSLQCTYSTYPASKVDTVGLTSLTLCYAAAETGDCVVQMYVPANDSETIYSRKTTDSAELSNIDEFESMKELRKQVKNPGAWQVLSDGSVVGIRQVTQHENSVHITSPVLRRRHTTEEKNHHPFANWEVWVTSPCGKPNLEECRSLLDQGEESNHLVVSGLGPKVTVGLRSVAFAFGNVIKLVITGGNKRYGAEFEDRSYELSMNTTSRRRKTGLGCKARSSS